MKVIACSALLLALNAAPAVAKDPLSSLRFLVGSWNCTYQAGKTRVYYKATYSYDLRDNWVRESDTWTGGGTDLGMITYSPKERGWTSVAMEPERNAFVFHGAGDNPNYIVYRSVYPTTELTDIFDRTSPTRYLLHFTQRSGGRTMKSTDVCVKE